MDYRSLIRLAIDEAKAHPRNQLPELAASTGIELLQRGSRIYARNCPWCQGRMKFCLRQTPSGWRFGCFRTTCTANSGGDAISFIALTRGLDRRQAVRAMLENAGIEHPWDRIQREWKGGAR